MFLLDLTKSQVHKVRLKMWELSWQKWTWEYNLIEALILSGRSWDQTTVKAGNLSKLSVARIDGYIVHDNYVQVCTVIFKV